MYLLYVSFIVTTKENLVVNIQKIVIKKWKHTTIKSHQIAKKDSKKGNKEQGIYKTVRRQFFKWQ